MPMGASLDARPPTLEVTTMYNGYAWVLVIVIIMALLIVAGAVMRVVNRRHGSKPESKPAAS